MGIAVLMGAHLCLCMDAMRCSHTFPTRAARSPAARDRDPEASSFYSRCEDAMLAHSRVKNVASVDVIVNVSTYVRKYLAKGQPEIERWPEAEID